MMQECVIELDFRFLGSIHIQFILAAFAASLVLKEFKQSVFCATLAFYYIFAYQLHCSIIGSDPDFVFRYLKWTGISFAFLLNLFIFCRRGWIDTKVLVVCASLEFVAITMNLIRMVDIRVNYAEFTDHFYSEVIMLTNWGFVLLAVGPVLVRLINKWK